MEFEWKSAFILLILIVAYNRITVFNYFAKFFMYYIYEIIVALYYLPMGIARPRNVLNLLAASYGLKYPSRFLGLKYKIEGIEYLKADKTFVIVANHQTSLDILGKICALHSL